MNDEITQLSARIKELGEKSTQVLTFLSFAIVVVASLGSSSTVEGVQRVAMHQAMRAWIVALFPILLGIVPVKEFKENNLEWYRVIRKAKVVLLWSAIVVIGYGVLQFFNAI